MATADPPSSPATFEELISYRRLLQDFCALHVPSIEHFASKDFPIFLLSVGESDSFDRIRHITSTATCYESLAACPERLRPKGASFEERAANFSAQAILLPQGEWKSDESAYIYCRCRGLPFVISRLGDSDLGKSEKQVTSHLARIFAQLDSDPVRLAIGEADAAETQKNVEEWYPPNAYHTYWTLELLDSCRRLTRVSFQEAARRLQVPKRSQQMVAWARQTLGYQVSLHTAESSALDSDQLAWSLAIFLRTPDAYLSKLSEQDFVRKAFECLFCTQTNVGTWPRYAPLFHYKKSGNAYCYVFETFTTVLKQALRPDAKFVRSVLKDHFHRLIRLWEYARTTQTRLDGHGRKLGWSSGHRANQPIESWATASVFAYAQCLRRLLGIWAREEALAALNRPRPVSGRKEAIRKLQQRSDIWKLSGPRLDEQLWTMFINHACTVTLDDRMEPDRQPVDEDCPRSAILFGPPGTSKTTLVKALSGCVQWDYIELHASHFVADGLPNVQRTADRIFRYLAELDHAVVLFDEIDELVRAREIEKDAFGRFLTTSMLPKLAELWEARRIMYFVATNHIEFFDPAITRSQRFDAVLFVSPPSFEQKKQQLEKILREEHGITKNIDFRVRRDEIEKSLEAFSCGNGAKEIPLEGALAKFALLRFDELGELAINVKETVLRGSAITSEVLTAALGEIKDGRWRGPNEYTNYLRGPSFERLDLTKVHTWRIRALPRNLRSSYIRWRNAKPVLMAPVKSLQDISILGHKVIAEPHGKVRIEPEGPTRPVRSKARRRQRQK